MADGTPRSRIFISWSKDLSKAIALELSPWLVNIFDQADPWVSDDAIDAGSRTYNSIADALNGSVFGIIVVTRANQFEPWLNYEAGALSNKFGSMGQTQVAPLLVDMENMSELTSPIKQYQANLLDLAGVQKLCRTLAPVMAAKPEAVASRVAMFWPDLERRIDEIKADEHTRMSGNARAEPVAGSDRMEEVVVTVRELKRLMDQPPALVVGMDKLFDEIRNFRKQVQLDFTRSVRVREIDENAIKLQVRQIVENAGLTLSSIRIGEAMPDGSIHLYLSIQEPMDETSLDRVLDGFNRVPKFGLNIGREAEYEKE